MLHFSARTSHTNLSQSRHRQTACSPSLVLSSLQILVMPSHSKPELTVNALLQSLNNELDRKKRNKTEDRMLSRLPKSVHGRLGPRINSQNLQISHLRGGRELCGAIFMCNRRTWKECLGQCLFGLPTGKKSLVEQVIPGMKLFLFEYDRRQLWGVFEAASYGGMDIIPNAYTGGSFPCQVRVKVPEACVALYEEEFCEAIRDNYFSLGKFHFELSEKQVFHLTSLFERKYFSANIMHFNLLESEDKGCILEECKPNGGLPLILGNEAHSLYPEDLLQVTNSPFVSNSEESRDLLYKNGESRIGRKSSGKRSLNPLPNGALDIVQSNVASLTGELGKGFDIVNANCLTFYDSNYHSIVEDIDTEDMILFHDNLSRLHSDRPIAKSVWARISGRSKSLVALESNQVRKSPEMIPVMTLPPKVLSKVNGEDDSLVQDQVLCQANVSEEVAEEFSVGFKRRRAMNNNASAYVDKTPSKRRRKLTRPSFEVTADEHLAEQGTFAAENTSRLSACGAPDCSKGSSMVGIGKDFTGNISRLVESPDKIGLFRDESKRTSSDPGEWIVRMSVPGCNQGNGALQSGHAVCQLNTLDLNLPVEASIQNDQGVATVLDNSSVHKDEKQWTTVTASHFSDNTKAKSPTQLEQHVECFNATTTNSLVCEMQQEPCRLALSLATQETVHLHSTAGIDDSSPADLAGHIQNQPQASTLVDDSEPDRLILVDVPEIFIGQSKQGGRAGGEGIEKETGLSGKEEKGSALQQPYISSESTSVDLVTTDSLRASSLSLAPCIPAKDFLDSLCSVSEHCDDRKAISHDLVQDIPLTLELGNGAPLPDVKLPSGNLYNRDEGKSAVVLDESSSRNQSTESNAISLDCNSGSNLMNHIDLKSFLSGLQVSGIRLQLGASPCLVLQLGDSAISTSNVHSQDQGGATSGQPES